MRRLGLGLAAAALTAIMAFPSVSSAGPMTESFSHTTPTQAAPFTDNFILPAFSTALGTLTSVEIDLVTNSTAEVDIINVTGVPQPFTDATASVPVTETGPGGQTITQTLIAGPIAGTAAPYPPIDSFPGVPGSSSSSDLVSPAEFINFENPPAGVNLSFGVVAGTGTFSGSAGPGVFFGGSADAGAVTTLIYTFTPRDPVPEPASLALLGSALAGIGFARRRRKSA